MATVHEQPIRIRWRDVDAYGHVNNAVYLTYLEEARDAWVREVLGAEANFVIARIEIDYRRELSLEDREVVVRCRGDGYGTSSVRTAEEILVGDETAAVARSVIVAHDAVARSSRPLTDAERTILDGANA